MRNQILINSTFNETRVALIEGNSLAEIYVERNLSPQLVGNIYKGNVEKIVPGMQAAFVDIGSGKSGFISVEDVYEESFMELIDIEERTKLKSNNQSIQEKLVQGQGVMVQVIKEPVHGKGPKLTSNISIPGKYLVLIAAANIVGISHKIEDESERERLIEIISRLKPDNLGFIARTFSEGISEKELTKEIKNLVKIWARIRKSYEKRKKANLIYETPSLTIRAVRDLVTYNINEIIIDDEKLCSGIRKYLSKTHLHKKMKIKHYNKNRPLFEKYQIDTELNEIYKKKVWLKSGGFLIIEETEGLTVIDVNTGRYIGKSNQDSTLLNVNLEAAKEALRQIRLRNLVGIIVIDFIDLKDPELRKKVLDTFKEGMANDKARTVIQDISQFSVLQLTRQRTRESILNTLAYPCPTCLGIGRIKSKDTLSYEILRKIKHLAFKPKTKIITLEAHMDIINNIIMNEEGNITSLKESRGLEIEFVKNNKSIDKFVLKNN
jgi:ribonuclease G